MPRATMPRLTTTGRIGMHIMPGRIGGTDTGHVAVGGTIENGPRFKGNSLARCCRGQHR